MEIAILFYAILIIIPIIIIVGAVDAILIRSDQKRNIISLNNQIIELQASLNDIKEKLELISGDETQDDSLQESFENKDE